MQRLLLPALLALALSGCAGSTTTTTTGTMPGMEHNHMMAKTVDVAMKGNKFVPDTVDLYEGDSVTWTHQDGATVPHNVVADDGSFDSNPNCASTVPAGVPLSQVCMVGGQTYTHRFDKAGTVTYSCRVHSGMTGTVRVLPHPANMTMAP
ncbi:MAG: plastocyanin/azurin family copper-binding protein [Thermoplasmatota archaeon]